jgi:hypothetical protein
MKAPRFTLDQLRPGLQEQVVAALHPAQASQPCKSATLRAAKAPVAIQTPPNPKKGRRVARTRNGGTWTEAHYWGALRSHLRRLFRFWKPAQLALKAAKLPGRPRFLCADCEKLFPRKGVQIDHVVPCGTLMCLSDLPGFLERLTPESPAAFCVRCRACHQVKTNAERKS